MNRQKVTSITIYPNIIIADSLQHEYPITQYFLNNDLVLFETYDNRLEFVNDDIDIDEKGFYFNLDDSNLKFITIDTTYYLKSGTTNQNVALHCYGGYKDRQSRYVPRTDTIYYTNFNSVNKYENNVIGLGKFINKIPKQRCSSNRISNDIILDVYTPKTTANIDTMKLYYDKNLRNIPFSFSKDLDKVHDSKVSTIQMTYRNPITNKSDIFTYQIKKNSNYNPVKIDSIFAKLIPFLPKK